MRKSVLSFAAAMVMVPALAMAAAGGGVCKFDGTATLPDKFGTTPAVQKAFSFGGTLKDVAAGTCAFPGTADAKGTITGNCAGNVHSGTAETPVGKVTFAGVCAGADCDGIAESATPAGFLYILAFDQKTITDAAAKCPTDEFKSATFTGAAIGGTSK